MTTKPFTSHFPGSQLHLQIGHVCTLPKSSFSPNTGNCDEIPCTIFVRLMDETEDESLLMKILRVIFLFPNHHKVVKNMVPFSHHFAIKEEFDLQIFILLEDGSNHQFTYRPSLSNVFTFINLLC
jgi:hypothetical protein